MPRCGKQACALLLTEYAAVPNSSPVWGGGFRQRMDCVRTAQEPVVHVTAERCGAQGWAPGRP
eukprot:360946-Chlamydomonas_euryale.AAC.8